MLRALVTHNLPKDGHLGPGYGSGKTGNAAMSSRTGVVTDDSAGYAKASGGRGKRWDGDFDKLMAGAVVESLRPSREALGACTFFPGTKGGFACSGSSSPQKTIRCEGG